MKINELKAMSEKQLCIWSSKVNAKELKAILKENHIKGYSKLKKAELLDLVLDLVINNEGIEIDSNNNVHITTDVEKVYNDTKNLNEEITIRTGWDERFEETLFARLKAKEITFNEYKDVCYIKEISIYVDNSDEGYTIDINNRFGENYSNYEHYVDADKKEDRYTYYSVLNKDFQWENVDKTVENHHWYDWEEEVFYTHNRIDKDGLQLAYEYDEDGNIALLVYKNYELLGSYVGDDISYIKRLVAYDDRLDEEDLESYKKLLKQLQRTFTKGQEIIDKKQEQERKEREQRRKKQEKYDKAYESWCRYYQPYSMGKFKFEDIWGRDGEIKNYSLWREMLDFTNTERKKQTDSWQQQYNNLFGNTAMTVKEEDKDVYKKIYRCASLKLHPDVAKDGGRAMKILNELKESWGI